MPTGLSADDAAQHGFAYRFAWGRAGLDVLAPECDVVVVVDVLRFTTAVSVAVDRGAIVVPCRWPDDGARDVADERGALPAGPTGPASLSPCDLQHLEAGTRLVLPSPNGSTLASAAVELGVPFVLAGSLRNAAATARRAAALAHGGAIAVIAAGEHWPAEIPSLRPALEDLLGAGAVLARLDPSSSVGSPCCSPEAGAARAAFVAARPHLGETLAAAASGRELARRGWSGDVAAAAALDVSDLAAQLVDGAFIAV